MSTKKSEHIMREKRLESKLMKIKYLMSFLEKY